MSIRKTPLQQAIMEAKEIEKVAYESARKALEETLSPKIEQAVKESLMELENQAEVAEVVEEASKEKIEEGVKIEVTPEGAITVETNNEVTGTPEIAVADNVENINTETPNTDINMDEMTNEEIYEVDATPATAEVPAEAPAEVPTEAPVAPTSENPFDALNQKLDAILDKVGNSEAPAQGAEGEVEIVDDETTSAPMGATPEAPVAPEAAPVSEIGAIEDEDVVYELSDDDGFVRETSGGLYDEIGDMEEIEIVDEDMMDAEGAEMEEMTGLSHSVQRRQPNRQHTNPQGHHAPVMPLMKEGEDTKIKAQQESKMDELKQENEGLKKTVQEYKESFVVLRKQINEVQVFNAKLAYVNKLFINGGLKNDEKVRIAEEFDKVTTVEDAKKLYNNLLKEVSEAKSVKGAPEEKLKSVKPSVQPQAEPSQTLYESTEMKRMKQLAGIINEAREF